MRNPKTEVNREKLISALNMTRPAVATKDYIPILTHFLFDGESVTAYNDLQAIKVMCELGIKGCVPAELFLKALQSFHSVTVTFTQQEGNILIESGKSKVKLPVLPSADFPVPNFKSLQARLEFLGSFEVPVEMLGGIQKCLVAVGNDTNHPAHMGITLKPQEGSSSSALYSTDNITISRFNIKNLRELKQGVILPTFFCQQLLSMAKTFKKGIESKVEVYDGALVVKFGEEALLFSKTLLDVAPVNFQEIIDKYVDETKLELYDLPESFESGIDRALLIQASESQKLMTVTVEDSYLKLKSFSSAREAVDEFEYAGADCQFDIDPTLVKRALPFVSQIGLLRRVMVLTSIDQTFMHLIAHTSR